MCGCVSAFVQTIFAGGFEEHRRWAELQDQVGDDPAFEQVEIRHEKQGYYIAWGKLATPADRDRLMHLVNECKVNESKVYGIFSQSVMNLKIEQPTPAEQL